jgi:hypothetical protein
MKLSSFHLSTIRRVRVGFDLTAPKLDPDAVSLALKIKPTNSAKRGDERRNIKGTLLQPHKEGWWQLSTQGKVKSRDINKHFEYLLKKLLPHRETILSFAKNGKTYFGVFWENTYLYAGNGPLISSQSIKGIAGLNANIGFDIYQIDEN